MAAKCAKCHYFRYCSDDCHKAHWRICHKDLCGQMSMVYDHLERCNTQYSKVVYGFMTGYEWHICRHYMSDTDRNMELEPAEPSLRVLA